ncbi:MAG: dihydroneopterin aldolase family protein [Halodesulfurarchaeum sp.]
MPTDAERACFEAGIKFGSLYHQFAGTPVSPSSAAGLAGAMEEAIENQPHCEEVAIEMDEDAIAEAAGGIGYTELTGRHFTAVVRVAFEGVEVTAEMMLDERGYPLMEVVSVEGKDAG